MPKGTNPGIKIPDVGEASPAVRTALQQIVTKLGMLARPVFAGLSGLRHSDLEGVTADQHHARQHAVTSTSDHTSTATPGQVLKADANGLPVNATNTDAQVSAAVTASHAQAHAIDGANHTAAGLTTGHVLQATSPTTIGFGAVPGLSPADTPAFTGIVLTGVVNEAARLALDLEAGSIVYQQDTGEFWFCTVT